MNKKYLVFGLMGLFVMAFAAAGLVNYLSNTVQEDVTVESPLSLNADLDDLADHTLNVRDFNLTNRADISVSTIVELSVSGDFNESNFGAEFETFLIGIEMPTEYDETVRQGACESQPLGGNYEDGYCYWDASTDKDYTGIVDGVYYVQMGDRESPTPIEAGQTLNGRLKLRFANNLIGDYTLSVQALVPEMSNDLTE